MDFCRIFHHGQPTKNGIFTQKNRELSFSLANFFLWEFKWVEPIQMTFDIDGSIEIFQDIAGTSIEDW